jgi:RNA polymerase sigma-70 factor (ECF subfamily)
MADSATEQEILAVYRDTIDTLYGYVSRRCGGDRALAEDVTQETWLRAVREWRRMGPPDRPLAWLCTVARNLVLNDARRAPAAPLDAVAPMELLAAVENGAGQHPVRRLEEEEAAASVRRALARLSRREAEVLEAFYWQRHPMARVADLLGISERAVEGRLRRARLKLRRELEATMDHVKEVP